MRNINDKVQLLINNLIAGVKLAAGTSIIGKVSIDQATANANQVVTKTGSVTSATLVAETTKKIGTVNVENIVTLHTFHDAATVAADGTALTVGTGKTLAIEISGTSTGRTVQFFGLSESDTKIAIMGIKLATLTSAVSTTGTGELWQFDVTGLKSVIIRLEAITDNNVTVKGRLVS